MDEMIRYWEKMWRGVHPKSAANMLAALVFNLKLDRQIYKQ